MNKKLSAFTIAATYVGTVVGAGFATGQEVLQFFVAFGLWGFVGISLASAIFIFFGISVMELGHKLKAKSHLPVIQAAGGRWTSSTIDIIITFFLFGALVSMGAGAGAVFVEQFGLPAIWGSLLLILLSLLTVLLGVSSVIESISFVAPILLTSVLGLSLVTLFSNPGTLVANLSWSDRTVAAVPYWPLAALLYASYNLILTVAVLAPLGTMSDPPRLRLGATWGGLGLGLGIAAIAAAVLTLAPRVTAFEVPMVAIAGSISPLARIAFSVVLFAEVYTTAVASLYGFASRLTDPDGIAYKWLAASSSALAFALAQFGFSTIVGTLYPAAGFAGLLLLGALAYGYLKSLTTGVLLPTPAAKPEPLKEPGLSKAGDETPEQKEE